MTPKPSGRRRQLIILRGLPGAGKTTATNTWIAGDPEHRAAVSRDSLRQHVYRMTAGRLSARAEQELTRLQHQMIRLLLAEGRHVAVDDTNLPEERITEWDRLARRTGAQLVIWDLRHVPIDVCIARDRERGTHGGAMVGADVIQRIAARGAATWESAPDPAPKATSWS